MSEGVWAVRKIPFVTAETAPTGHPNKLLLNGSTVFWSSCSQLLFSVNVWWLLLAFVVEIASVGRAFVSLTLACEIFFLTGVKFLDRVVHLHHYRGFLAKMNDQVIRVAPRCPDGPTSRSRFIMASQVQAGHFVQLLEGEFVPADIVVVYSSNEDKAAWFDSRAVTGRVNVEKKKAVGRWEFHREGDLTATYPLVEVDPLHQATLVGSVMFSDYVKPAPFSAVNVAHQGSRLMCTKFVLGVVLRTGPDSSLARLLKTPKEPFGAVAIDRTFIAFGMLISCVAIAVVTNTAMGRTWSIHGYPSDVAAFLNSPSSIIILFTNASVVAPFLSDAIFVFLGALSSNRYAEEHDQDPSSRPLPSRKPPDLKDVLQSEKWAEAGMWAEDSSDSSETSEIIDDPWMLQQDMTANPIVAADLMRTTHLIFTLSSFRPASEKVIDLKTSEHRVTVSPLGKLRWVRPEKRGRIECESSFLSSSAAMAINLCHLATIHFQLSSTDNRFRPGKLTLGDGDRSSFAASALHGRRESQLYALKSHRKWIKVPISGRFTSNLFPEVFARIKRDYTTPILKQFAYPLPRKISVYYSNTVKWCASFLDLAEFSSPYPEDSGILRLMQSLGAGPISRLQDVMFVQKRFTTRSVVRVPILMRKLGTAVHGRRISLLVDLPEGVVLFTRGEWRDMRPYVNQDYHKSLDAFASRHDQRLERVFVYGSCEVPELSSGFECLDSEESLNDLVDYLLRCEQQFAPLVAVATKRGRDVMALQVPGALSRVIATKTGKTTDQPPVWIYSADSPYTTVSLCFGTLPRHVSNVIVYPELLSKQIRFQDPRGKEKHCKDSGDSPPDNSYARIRNILWKWDMQPRHLSAGDLAEVTKLMSVLPLCDVDVNEVRNQLVETARTAKRAAESPGDFYKLIVILSGRTLNLILKTPALHAPFGDLLLDCPCLVLTWCTPVQMTDLMTFARLFSNKQKIFTAVGAALCESQILHAADVSVSLASGGSGAFLADIALANYSQLLDYIHNGLHRSQVALHEQFSYMASSTFLAATTMMFVNTDISNEWRMLMNLQFILLCLFVTGWLAMFWRRSRNLYLEGGWSFVRLCLRGVVYAVVMMLRDDSTSFTMTCLTTLLLVFKLARRHMYAVLLGGRSLTWKLAIPLWLVVFYLILAPIVYNVVKYTGVPWKGLNDYECLLVFPVLAIETGFMVSHLVIREPIRDRSRRQEMLSKAVDFTRKSILSHRTQETSKLARNTLSNFRRAAPAPIQHTTQNETTWVEAYDYYGSNNAGEDIPLIAEMDLEEAMCRWTLTYADKELETQFRSIYLEGTESWKWVTRVSLLLNLVAMLWQAALAVPYVPASFIVYIGFLLLSGVLACVVGLKSYRPAHIIWSFVFCLFFFLLWMTKAPVQGSPVLVGHKYLSWPLVGEMQRILLVSSGAVYLFHAIHLLKQYDWGSSLALELHLLSVVPVLAYCIVMSSVCRHSAEMSRRSFLLAQEHGVLKRNLAEVLRKMRPRANDVDYMREGAIEEALTGHLNIETACFPYVSVIFVGVEDFQNLILTLDPDALVKTLDALFCSLDAVASAQKAFKVETVGETYLAATGLCAKPDVRDCVDHALNFAVEVLLIKAWSVSPRSKQLELRVGVHTGRAIGGVVGSLKPQYALFGDTTNFASRMKSTGFKGRVHVSMHTYDHAKNLSHYAWASTGGRMIKGKGFQQTYVMQLAQKYPEYPRGTLDVDLTPCPVWETNNRTTWLRRETRLTPVQHADPSAQESSDSYGSIFGGLSDDTEQHNPLAAPERQVSSDNFSISQLTNDLPLSPKQSFELRPSSLSLMSFAVDVEERIPECSFVSQMKHESTCPPLTRRQSVLLRRPSGKRTNDRRPFRASLFEPLWPMEEDVTDDAGSRKVARPLTDGSQHSFQRGVKAGWTPQRRCTFNPDPIISQKRENIDLSWLLRFHDDSCEDKYVAEIRRRWTRSHNTFMAVLSAVLLNVYQTLFPAISNGRNTPLTDSWYFEQFSLVLFLLLFLVWILCHLLWTGWSREYSPMLHGFFVLLMISDFVVDLLNNEVFRQGDDISALDWPVSVMYLASHLGTLHYLSGLKWEEVLVVDAFYISVLILVFDYTPFSRQQQLMTMMLILSYMSGSYVVQKLYRKVWFEANEWLTPGDKALLALIQIIPRRVVMELEMDSSYLGYLHPHVAFLFSDICGFTKWASQTEARTVLSFLNKLFLRFDELVQELKLFKVHTIGDAYIVIGNTSGRPEHLQDICFDVFQFAIGLLMHVDDVTSSGVAERVDTLSMRVGCHVGTCVGGILGTGKLRYDVWGLDVLIGEKMEQTATPGRVNVSQGFLTTILGGLDPADHHLRYEPNGVHEIESEQVPSFHLYDQDAIAGFSLLRVCAFNTDTRVAQASLK